MATPTVVSIALGNDLPWVNIRSTLTQTLYSLDFRYNSRMQRWIANINDSQNNPLISGLPLLIGRNLNGRFVTPGLPPGFLFATDDTNQGNQPTRYSFGVDHGLFYYDPTGQT